MRPYLCKSDKYNNKFYFKETGKKQRRITSRHEIMHIKKLQIATNSIWLTSMSKLLGVTSLVDY